MNMTVVIVTRPMEFVLLLVFALACIAPLAYMANGRDANNRLQAVADESRELDDNQLSSLVRELGGQLEGDMEEQMDKLMRELEAKREKRQSSSSVSEQELERLRQANKLAGQDIRARVEMAGDTAGALPQWSLGDKASSFLSATSERLTAASSYVGNKLRSIGSSLASRMPKRLKRFFKWPTFLAFKVRHRKVYRSAREELYRQMVFLRTHVKVGMQHLRFLLHHDRHLLGANQYADMTPDEIFQALNNEELEAEARETRPESPAEHARVMDKLRQLAASKKNVFGQEVVVSKSSASHHLSKRSLDAGTSDDELDADDETDFQNIGLDFDPDSFDDGTTSADETDEEADASAMTDEEAFKLVDEFANVDLKKINELDSNLDDALNGANKPLDKFEPIDLRDTGCVVRSENQNKCGNCYSQAVTALASYYNCIAANDRAPARYNAYFPSTCGRYMFEEGKVAWINGCVGGRVSQAIKFVKLVGLPYFQNYNVARISAHVNENDKCAYPRPHGPIEEHNWPLELNQVEYFKNSRYTLMQLDEVDLHLRTIGPVIVNIQTWHDFEFYEAGIYNDQVNAREPQLHSMMIVGHDHDPVSGLEYYIIWNSGGIVWGENGFLRVSASSLNHFALQIAGLPPNNI